MLSYSTTRKKRMFGGGLRTVSQWPIKKKTIVRQTIPATQDF
jgi:hypothetical protein